MIDNETGLNLHYDHNCRICGCVCAWCDSCGYAHCFNGHEHKGFEGRLILGEGIEGNPANSELRRLFSPNHKKEVN